MVLQYSCGSSRCGGPSSTVLTQYRWSRGTVELLLGLGALGWPPGDSLVGRGVCVASCVVVVQGVMVSVVVYTTGRLVVERGGGAWEASVVAVELSGSVVSVVLSKDSSVEGRCDEQRQGGRDDSWRSSSGVVGGGVVVRRAAHPRHGDPRPDMGTSVLVGEEVEGVWGVPLPPSTPSVGKR